MRRFSWLALALEPLAGSLWILFLVWSGILTVVWCFAIDAAHLSSTLANPDLARALGWFLHLLDPVWVTLAAVNVYAAIAESEGMDTVRRWGLVVLGGAFLLAWTSVKTGYPLGPISFTDHLGAPLGTVPFGVPLLWLAVVLGGRETALRLLPRVSHNQIAMATGVLALATAVNLESLACHLRWWWIWDAAASHALSTAPVWNYATWLGAAAVFAWFMRDETVASELSRRSRKPVITFAVMNAIFLLTHLARVAL